LVKKIIDAQKDDEENGESVRKWMGQTGRQQSLLDGMTEMTIPFYIKGRFTFQNLATTK